MYSRTTRPKKLRWKKFAKHDKSYDSTSRILLNKCSFFVSDGAKSVLLSNTALNFNSDYLNAESEIKLGNSYRSFYFNIMPHYNVNENVSFVSNISYQYYNIDFSKMNFTENTPN